MANSPSSVETIANPQQEQGPVERLMSLTANAGLLRSTDGCFCARVQVGSRHETC